MRNLSGKVALITGSSKGIGAGIAKRLAADGASVVVNYTRSGDGPKDLSALLPCSRWPTRVSDRYTLCAPRMSAP